MAPDRHMHKPKLICIATVPAHTGQRHDEQLKAERADSVVAGDADSTVAAAVAAAPIVAEPIYAGSPA